LTDTFLQHSAFWVGRRPLVLTGFLPENAAGGGFNKRVFLFSVPQKNYSSKVFVFIEFHYLCIPKILGVVLYCILVMPP
jgi:hypothetical protein